MKGSKLYSRLDILLSDPHYGNRFEFTYIGNKPANLEFINVKVIKPLFGDSLAQELRKNHVYITGSINEPGGNHQNEAGLSGLPIIYLNSGSMREYCQGFGVELQSDIELEDALERVYRDYRKLREKMMSFPHTASKMLSEYLEVLEDLERSRGERLQTKTLFKRIQLALKFHMSF